jgi:hypothetical protein
MAAGQKRRVCLNCGQRIRLRARRDAVFCSAACRAERWRWVQGTRVRECLGSKVGEDTGPLSGPNPSRVPHVIADMSRYELTGRYRRAALAFPAALPIGLTVVVVPVLVHEHRGFSGSFLLVLAGLFGPIAFMLVAPPVIRVENTRLFVRNGYGRPQHCVWTDVSAIALRVTTVRWSPEPSIYLIVSFRGRRYTTDIDLSPFPGTPDEIAAGLSAALPRSIPFTPPSPSSA